MRRDKKSVRRTVTRRDFLKGAAYGTLGVALGMDQYPARAAEKAVPFASGNPMSRVVLIRDDAAVDQEHKVYPKVVAGMIDTAVKALSGEKDAAKAWKSFIRSEETVGVKYTHCGWMRVHTEEAVIDAIVARLVDIGISTKRIHADDSGIPLAKCTALINVPSIKVHAHTGIAAAIKNFINFSDRPNAYHLDGSQKLGELWLMPDVKGKTRLVIVDALRPYFGPGPQINPLHRWDYKGILVGTDPVAIDATCLRICQVKRNLFKGEEWPITPPPKSIAAADTKYRLGTSDPTKIKLIRLGWEKDALI